jgi:hypothetical protein
VSGRALSAGEPLKRFSGVLSARFSCADASRAALLRSRAVKGSTFAGRPAPDLLSDSLRFGDARCPMMRRNADLRVHSAGRRSRDEIDRHRAALPDREGPEVRSTCPSPHPVERRIQRSWLSRSRPSRQRTGWWRKDGPRKCPGSEKPLADQGRSSPRLARPARSAARRPRWNSTCAAPVTIKDRQLR